MADPILRQRVAPRQVDNAEPPSCPECGEDMTLTRDRDGPFYECPDCGVTREW